MPQLRGRHEVDRRRRRINAAIERIDGAGMDAELTAHYARYLCVLVSGFTEQSVKGLIAQYCRVGSNERIQRYVGKQVSLVRNIDDERLRQLMEAFDPGWWAALASNRPDELLAFGSVAAVRNSVSHGGDGGITIATLKQYFEQICLVLGDLADVLDPVSA